MARYNGHLSLYAEGTHRVETTPGYILKTQLFIPVSHVPYFVVGGGNNRRLSLIVEDVLNKLGYPYTTPHVRRPAYLVPGCALDVGIFKRRIMNIVHIHKISLCIYNISHNVDSFVYIMFQMKKGFSSKVLSMKLQ